MVDFGTDRSLDVRRSDFFWLTQTLTITASFVSSEVFDRPGRGLLKN